MALEESRQTIETEQTIGDERTQVLVRAEAIVPGAGRDAVTILLDEARFCLNTADVQADRVVIDGAACAQALYRLGEEGEVAALQAVAPLSRAIDVGGAQPGMSCLADGQAEHVETVYENGHIVFLITIGLHVRVLQLQKSEVLTSLAGEDGIEQKQEAIKSVKLSAESSAQTILEGDARMPPVLDARTALMDWGTVRVDSVEPDLGGVKVSGAVLAEALVGSGVPGRPVALVKYTLPFQQLVDLPDWLSKNAGASAGLNRLEAKLKPLEDGTMALHFDAAVDVHVQAMGEDSVSVLSDAYGTGETDLQCETGEIRYCAGVDPILHRETVRANLLLGEGAPSVSTVVAVRARPQLAQIEPIDGGSRISGLLEAQALYLASGSGALCSARDDLPFSLDLPFVLTDSDDVRLDVESADASALMNDRLEMSCALRVCGAHRREGRAQIVSSVQAKEAEKQPFSVVLYWPSEDEALWEIGKRYRMPSERIAQLNSSRQSGAPLVVRG